MPTKTSIPITVDHREADTPLVRALQNDADVTVDFAVLEVGDFRLAENCFAEKKASNDFSQSIFDKRIFRQIEAAKERQANLVMLYEGSPLATKRTGLPQLIGALSHITVNERIASVQVDNSVQAALALKTMARHAQQGLGYTLSMLPTKPKDVRKSQEAFIGAIPGVGITRAKSLLDAFGSPIGVMSATREQLRQVEGIGDVIAQRIHEFLNAALM